MPIDAFISRFSPTPKNSIRKDSAIMNNNNETKTDESGGCFGQYTSIKDEDEDNGCLSVFKSCFTSFKNLFQSDISSDSSEQKISVKVFTPSKIITTPRTGSPLVSKTSFSSLIKSEQEIVVNLCMDFISVYNDYKNKPLIKDEKTRIEQQMQEFIWSLFDKKLINHSDISISYEEKFKIVEKILLKYNAAYAESTVGSLLSFSYFSSYASSAAIPIQSQNKKVSKASDDFNFSRSSALIPTPEESFSHRSDSVLLNMIGAKKFSYT